MPTYVTLLNLTQKGVETIKQSPQRVEAAKQMAKSAGGEIKAVYYTMGTSSSSPKRRTMKRRFARVWALRCRGTFDRKRCARSRLTSS